MWETIIDELSETESIGAGFPIACARHPETTRFACEPGQISLMSPDGELPWLADEYADTGHRGLLATMVNLVSILD
jgi:hypothetical protein